MSSSFKCENFSSAIYAGLDGIHSITASHVDVTRAMMTVGYPSYMSAIGSVGRWRATMLHAMTHGYLDARLRTTPYFRNLEQSERSAVTFLLAQAFTLWFAQEHMRIVCLVHVQGSEETWTVAVTGTVSKTGAGQPKANSRPDFIGWAPGERHVFETKGRTRRVFDQLMGSALGQVCAIATVNGQAPATRVAACFVFRHDGVEGRLQDPPAGSNALDLSFNEIMALEKGYAFFLDSGFRASADREIPDFLTVDIGDGVRYGIDELVLERLAKASDVARAAAATPATAELQPSSAEPLVSAIAERHELYRARRSENTSVGRDGILLRDPRSSGRRLLGTGRPVLQ